MSSETSRATLAIIFAVNDAGAGFVDRLFLRRQVRRGRIGVHVDQDPADADFFRGAEGFLVLEVDVFDFLFAGIDILEGLGFQHLADEDLLMNILDAQSGCLKFRREIGIA